MSSASEDDRLVLDVLDRYLSEREQGLNPSIDRAIAQHPHLASRLRDCLESLEAMEQFSTGLRDSLDQSLLPTIKDYHIVCELGRGGMGIVYQAEQISLSRSIALKILPMAAMFESKNVERFKNEALATAKLEHPGIINVYSVGIDNGIHYYTMQLVDGRSLAQVISDLRSPSTEVAQWATLGISSGIRTEDHVERAGSESSPELTDRSAIHPSSIFSSKETNAKKEYFRGVARIGRQAAMALQHAHDHGIIHRDIKPSNLLLDSRGKVFISDFGLARIHGGTELTATGDMLGTLRYMSPEQAFGRAELVDHRTDLYSLGATLYELLTCRNAVPGKGKREVLENLQNEHIVSPTKIDPLVPSDLETIILKALANDRDQRYLNAKELANDLQRFLNDQPILATRPTLQQKLSKWVKRNRWFATTSAIFLLLLVAGSTLSSFWIYGQNEQLRIADAELKDQNKTLKQLLERATNAESKIERAPETLELLGLEYFKQRDYEKSIKMFDAVLMLTPQANKSRLFRARAFALTNQSDQAFQELDHLINSGHELGLSHFYRGWLHLKQRDNLPAARRDLEQAKRFHYDHPELNYFLANLALMEQDYQAAKRYAQTALQLNQHTLPASIVHILCNIQLGEPGEAREIVESIHSNNQEPWHGKYLLIEAICKATENAKRNSAGVKLAPDIRNTLYQGLRWYRGRMHQGNLFDRHVAKSLLDVSLKTLDLAEVDVDIIMQEIARHRIESEELVRLARVGQGQEKPVSQSKMNRNWGPRWTPIDPGNPERDGCQLFWRPSEQCVGRRLAFQFTVGTASSTKDGKALKPGPSQITAYLSQANDYGTFQFYLNGKKLGEAVDLYDPAPFPGRAHAAQKGETNLGVGNLVEGLNQLTIEVKGKNEHSVGYCLGVDFIDFWPIGFRPGRSGKRQLVH